MTTSAILLFILFVVVIWGGLVVSSIWLARTDDDTTGELGSAPVRMTKPCHIAFISAVKFPPLCVRGGCRHAVPWRPR